MKLLALDLGTHTGWAAYIDGTIESGVQTFDVRRGESPGIRYLRFNSWLAEIGTGARLIVYEQFHQRGGAATELAAGFATRCQEFAAKHGIEHSAVHSATLKKFATGSGKASKDEMLIAAQQRWPTIKIQDDNQADALWLLAYALEEWCK